MDLNTLYKEEGMRCLKDIQKILEKIQKGKTNKEIFLELRRAAHTLKGSSWQMHYDQVGSLAFSLEKVAGELAEERVDLDKTILSFLKDIFTNLEKTFQDTIGGVLRKNKNHTSLMLSKKTEAFLQKLQEKEISKNEKKTVSQTGHKERSKKNTKKGRVV